MSNENSTGTKRPNVIWLFGDQHRGQALGCSGDPNVHTPNIDNLAASGVHFTKAVAGIPLCCPSRGSIVTGRYPHLAVPGHEHRLPPEQPTIAHVMNEAGYKTAYFGKWHLDGFKEGTGRAAFHMIPPERRGGFNHWVGYENNNSQWDSWVHGGEGTNAFHYRLPGYETDGLTKLFVEYLQERGKERMECEQAQPFFAVLSVQPPHDPYIAPESFRKGHNAAGIKLRPNVPSIPRIEEQARKDLAGYYGMIENWDWNIGQIMTALQENGLAEDTHIMFFSDHGDMHGSHGQFRKMSPWEESIRVPMIISGEKPFYGRQTGEWNVPFNHVDVAPTTLGLCGITKPDWMQGSDLSALRLGGPQPELPDSAYLQSVIPTGHGHSVDRPWRGIVTTDGWKYVCLENTPWLLFNLNEDPYEQVNMAYNSLYNHERKRLNDRLRQWVEDTGDEFRLPTL
ncbi:sulfatase family protein [Paenibacillus solani]|uniref:sulfatase family protein n=1 Tax=Paenibacillus solani TaxID=1705565 RepID=UPI003D2DAF70